MFIKKYYIKDKAITSKTDFKITENAQEQQTCPAALLRCTETHYKKNLSQSLREGGMYDALKKVYLLN